MNFNDVFAQMNWLAILVAALASFALGGLWYSPVLFGNVWMRENHITKEDAGQANMTIIFGTTFILQFVAATVLAMFIGPNDINFGAMAGFMAGVGWVATSVGTHYLFERKSLTLFFINAGYSVVLLTLMGVILGAWK